MKRLSIIIVTYNSEKDIYDCINSIFQYSDIPADELEIIVVDNGSVGRDAMFENIRSKYGSDIILIGNSHNGGYGQGNNVGIRRASAPVLLVMNPDVRLAEPVFSTVLEAFDGDAGLGMYGIKQYLSPTKTSRHSFSMTFMMNGYLWALLTGLFTRIDIYLPKCMYLTGSFFFVRKDMFEKVGLFDESVFMYGEEDDIHYRMVREFGTNIIYNRKLHYIHLALGRKPNLEYEKKLYMVALYHHERKGWSRIRTTSNFIRSTRVRLLKERVKVALGRSDELCNVLQDFRKYLKDCLVELKNDKICG